MTLWLASIKAIPAFMGSLVLLLLAWVIGQRISTAWNIRQKQKENNLENAREFHRLYGEFIAIWRLWNYFISNESISANSARRWDLYDRACTAEGKMEALLVRLACERALSSEDIDVLGRFRQVYQVLRDTMRKSVRLDWSYSEHPDYVEFKTLSPKVALLALGSQGRTQPSAKHSAEQLLEMTSNWYEAQKTRKPSDTRS